MVGIVVTCESVEGSTMQAGLYSNRSQHIHLKQKPPPSLAA